MVLSKSSNKKSTVHIVPQKGVLTSTLLLLLSSIIISPVAAHQRDTIGVGGRNYFVENMGQWDHPARYEAQMHNAALFVETGGLTVVVRENASQMTHFHQKGTKLHAYKVHFVGANAQADIVGEDIDEQGGYDNYYYGHQPEKWVSHLPHYWTVRYNDLYPGIDMDLKAASMALKSNFYVAAGADPTAIVMEYEGLDKMYLSNGNLILRTSVGEFVEMKPYAYQETDTGRHEVAAHYQMKGNEVRFALGDYDTLLPLVIDPVLHFSTYTGSQADNWGTTATYDLQKNTYTAGIVFGENYPVSVGAYDGSYNGNADIGIFKFDSTGSQRLFATYLGGRYADMPHSMYVNAFDELVVFGTTGSDNFPVTPNAYDTTFNGGTNLQFENTTEINFPHGSDIFVCRFNSDGSQLQASTYVGGTGNDGLNYRSTFNSGNTIMEGNDSLYYNYGDGARGELITDDLNNVYVGSTTMSVNFPTTSNTFRSVIPSFSQCGIVFKIDYNLQNMIWSTFLGGTGSDAVYSIDVDNAYNLLVCGGTTSNDFPTTPGAFQTTYGGGSTDGFVSKISYNGDELMYSSYFGSSQYDQLYFVRNGRHDEVFVYGQTKAPGSTMIYNANYNVPGSGMLLARFNADLSERVWSTVFGTPLGRPNLSPTAFAADVCNRVYAAGWGRDFVVYGSSVNWHEGGSSGMETTPDAIQTTTDGQDFYIMSIDENASHLEYATFFGELHDDSQYGGGSDHVDGGTSRFDKMSTLYQSVCASCGGYNNFPTTTDAWSNTNASYNCNNAIFRINIHNDFPVAECQQPLVGCSPPYTVNFMNTGRGDNFVWHFGDGDSSTLRNPQHTFQEAGQYTVQLVANMASGCRLSDTTTVLVWVLDEAGAHNDTLISCNGEQIQIGPQPMQGCTYEWIQGHVSDPSIANPFVTEGGIYILRTTGNSGCSQTDTVTVVSRNILDTLMVSQPTCPGYADGMATAIVDSTEGEDAHYYWDGVEGSATLTGLSADGMRHTLRVEANGCSTEQTFTLQDPPLLQLEVSSKSILCDEDCDGWIRIQYSLPGYLVGDTMVRNLCEGTYTVTVSDTNGCPYSTSQTIVRDSMLQNMSVWADDSIIYLTESTQLHTTHVAGASYTWSDPSTLNRTDIPDPIATPTDTVSVYGVTVVDSMGCAWYGSLMIQCTEIICGRPNVFIPNAFSPNNDGVNDRLCFQGDFILDFYLAIYTRWGEKVFETHDIHDCWDGRYNNNWCMPGVYTYVCKIKCEAGFENLLKGDITLIR